MMLFIISTFNIIVIWLDTKGILLKLIAGQKTVPMSDYFSLFIVSSDFIQIGYVGGHLKANMMYYHIYLYHGSKYNYYCVITQTLQNGQTLGQFFELL